MCCGNTLSSCTRVYFTSSDITFVSTCIYSMSHDTTIYLFPCLFHVTLHKLGVCMSTVCHVTPLLIQDSRRWPLELCLMSVEIALGQYLLPCFMSLCLTFVAVVDCVSNPCRNGATCYYRYYGFSCSCRSGFTGSRCEVGESDTSCSSMIYFPVISVFISLFPLAVSFWQLHCAISVTCT